MSHEVKHIPERCAFVVELAGDEAYLSYQRTGTEVIFLSTFVPQSMRGTGVAEKLVRSGLRWAREQQLSVSSECWYVDKWLRRKSI